MYEDYPEIPIEDLAELAEQDFRDRGVKKYILCLRVNSESVYNNIYLAALVIDYEAAVASGQSELLKKILISLSDPEGFHEESYVPSFISLDVFEPYSETGKVHYGGTIF